MTFPFHVEGWHGSRNQWQCSAKYEGTTRAHPDIWKWRWKIFFRASRLYTLPSAVAGPL